MKEKYDFTLLKHSAVHSVAVHMIKDETHTGDLGKTIGNVLQGL